MENKDGISKKKHKDSAHRHVRSMSSNVDVLWTHNKRHQDDHKRPSVGSPPKGLISSSSMSNIPKLTSQDLNGPFYEVDLNEEVKKEEAPPEDLKRSRSKKILTSIKDIFTKSPITSPRKSAPSPREITSPRGLEEKSNLDSPRLKIGTPRKVETPRKVQREVETPRKVEHGSSFSGKVEREEDSSSGSSGKSEVVSGDSSLSIDTPGLIGEVTDNLLRTYKKGKWWDATPKSKKEVEKLMTLRLLYTDYKKNDPIPYIDKDHEGANPHLTTCQHLTIETVARHENPKIFQYFLTIKYLLMWEKAPTFDQTLDFSLIDYYVIVCYSFDDAMMEDLEVDYYYPRSFFLAPIPSGLFEGLTIYPITINNGKLRIKFARDDINPLSYRELIELFRDGKYRRVIEGRRKTNYFIDFILFSTTDFVLSSFDFLFK